MYKLFTPLSLVFTTIETLIHTTHLLTHTCTSVHVFFSLSQVEDIDEGGNAEVEFVQLAEGLQNEELLFEVDSDGVLTTSRYATLKTCSEVQGLTFRPLS